jgi:DNA processing protein
MNDNFPIVELNSKDLNYPDLLLKIPSPPKKIFIKGTLTKNQRSIAIVGTRKCSKIGEKIAYEFSSQLAQRGCTIISGLALGIDTAAHLGALDSKGITWAVMAHGLDTIHPSTNRKIAQKILESGGLLISEYPPKTPAYANQFILRNRIISGLSSAVLIIEAPKESGALATAKFAIQQKKPVFVVPGSILSPLYDGSHQLIRNGARLVTSVKEILSDLGWQEENEEFRSKIQNQEIFENKMQKIIFDALKKEGGCLSVDKICQITKLKPQDASAALTQMVFNGIVIDESGKYKIAKIK